MFLTGGKRKEKSTASDSEKDAFFSLDQLAAVVIWETADDDEDNIDDVPDTESTGCCSKRGEIFHVLEFHG